MVAWLLLTASVLWGIWLSIRPRDSKPRPNWLLDLHRWLGGLAVSFTGVHLAGIFFDNFVDFSIKDLFVPFSTTWHPVAVAYGIVAFYFLVAVEATSLMRRHMTKRVWHGIHLTSYVLFWIASIHGLTAGTDSSDTAFRLAALIGMIVVGIGTLTRLRMPPKAERSGSRARVTSGTR